MVNNTDCRLLMDDSTCFAQKKGLVHKIWRCLPRNGTYWIIHLPFAKFSMLLRPIVAAIKSIVELSQAFAREQGSPVSQREASEALSIVRGFVF